MLKQSIIARCAAESWVTSMNVYLIANKDMQFQDLADERVQINKGDKIEVVGQHDGLLIAHIEGDESFFFLDHTEADSNFNVAGVGIEIDGKSGD